RNGIGCRRRDDVPAGSRCGQPAPQTRARSTRPRQAALGARARKGGPRPGPPCQWRGGRGDRAIARARRGRRRRGGARARPGRPAFDTSPGARLVLGVAGGMLALGAARRRSGAAVPAGLMGVALLGRVLSTRRRGPARGAVVVTKTLHVGAPVDVVFDIWSRY